MVNDLVIELLADVGLLGIGVIIGLFLFLNYPKLKLILSDVLRFFGWMGRWVRNKSLETEVEGAINLFTKNFNAELASSILPGCRVQWVDEGNQKNFMQEGTAIVRLSFDSENHDLNLYNATYAYVKIGILQRTKPYLRKAIVGAIDLLLTRMLILQSGRRQVLSVLNDRFKEEADELKAIFLKLEEMEDSGLFKPVLLQEFHFLGEVIGEKVPKKTYEEEAEKFLEWLYDLATREQGERSDLKFVSEHIKVGVILVADTETFDKYGLRPYLKRAMWYAANDFKCIYVCSRGTNRSKITKQIAHDLASKSGFDMLTKKPDVIRHDNQGNTYKITCIALKPDLTSIVQIAWARLQNDFSATGVTSAMVKEVIKDSLVVDAEGLRVEIPKKYASSLDIPDLRRYFENDQELQVRILEINPDTQTIVLSNCDSDTDPKKLIDQLQASLDETVKGNVTRIIKSNDQEVGINISFQGKAVPGLLPRKGLTYSRFVPLSGKFPVGSSLKVIPTSFDVRRKSYVCKLADLNDPWDNMAKYMAGMPVTATIRQVAERYLTCELEEGIEGFVPVGEVSWDSIEENLKAIKKYVVGSVVTAQITRIETARRVVLLSTKRIVKNPVQDYFELNKNTIIHVTVHAVSSFGAEVTINGTPYRGYVPVSEVLWGFCRNVGDYLKPGQTISAKPLRYNEYRNNIIVSPKRSTPNDFDTFRTSHQVGAVVKGRVYIIEDDKIGIRIEFDEGLLTEAYVHKSQLSSVLFIDEKLIHEILDIGKEYKFLVKRFDTKSKVVELSRKEFLRATIGELSYGTEYPAKIIKSRNGYIACGDNFEGVLIEKGRRGMAYPKSCMVIVAGIDRNKNRVELTVSSHT